MPILLFPLDAINHDLVLLVTDRWGNNLTPTRLGVSTPGFPEAQGHCLMPRTQSNSALSPSVSGHDRQDREAEALERRATRLRCNGYSVPRDTWFVLGGDFSANSAIALATCGGINPLSRLTLIKGFT